jgi:TonB-linked SusC/RagA family outer membrane protein
MQLTAYVKSRAFLWASGLDRTIKRKLLMSLKITMVLLTIASLHVSARGFSQSITLSERNVPLTKVMADIERQCQLSFVYGKGLLLQAHSVTIDVKNEGLPGVLEQLFRDQPLEYVLSGEYIVLRPKAVPVVQAGDTSLLPHSPVRVDVHGTVYNETEQPLAGANVTVKGTGKGTTTDEKGEFELKRVDENATMIFSSVGMETLEMKVRGKANLIVKTKKAINSLDETVIIAYGTTTRRLNTGDVSSITAEQIARQPVTNVLGALEGLAPGLSVLQGDGLPGGKYKVTIRGENSLQNGSEPLYIIDGVPFSNTSLGQFPGNSYQSSPLNTISPSDIERIDILKDADATAIYGSRGADGVILITTKKGKAGKTGLTINAYAGISNATRLMKWLNGPQYLEMRREAFKNDGITPDIYNAPDLLLWDTTRYTDWQKLIMGGTAHTDEGQVALTGGTGKTQFRVASTYHHETPLYGANPYVTKHYGYSRGSVSMSLSHASQDNKFNMSVSAQYTADKSNYSGATFSEIPLPPDAPAPFNSQGKLNWSENGGSFDNPFGALRQSYDLTNNMLMASTDLKYMLLPGLSLKLNMGYNKVENATISSSPKAAQDPANNPVSSSNITSNQGASWSVEPQLEYVRRSRIGKFDLLAGATWQDQPAQGLRTSVYNYSNEDFLGTLTGAASVRISSSASDYRYNAFYGRLNYDYNDKYLLNFTGRRDGSSRFGPGRQFANFGAIGAAWIFTKEDWFKSYSGPLSFGKLRGSYGITGSDNIGNYQFVDTWYPSSTGSSYNGAGGFTPANVYNPDYAWETNKKLEAALELGFIKDRILVTTSFYRNRSGNQLISYKLPTQTGFYSVLENFPAVVQNSGIEITVNTTNIRTKKFQWTTTFNLSVNRNKLLAFPGLDSSSYANSYAIGKPITIGKFFQYIGVDPQTGLYSFNGTNFNKDRTVIKDAYGPPRFFGGLENRLAWNGWELSFFIQFDKAYGQGYASRMSYYGPPGTMNNQPVYVLDRWQKPGDRAPVQRYSTSGSASSAFYTYGNSSDAAFVSTSFIRFKNFSLAYNLPASMLRTIKFRNIRVYLQGQNLGIITKYQGADPENAGVGNPLLRVWTGGIQFDF